MIVEPIERTLIISNKNCKEYKLQKGGNPVKIIGEVNNAVNKYIFFENCEDEFTFDDSLNKKNDIIGSTYLGRGSFTSVFAIKSKSGKTFILRIEEQKTTLILNNFIKQWKEDKKMFPKNIINIYAYGIAMANNIIVGTYTITNKYNDYAKIEKLNLYQKNKFMFNMLKFLSEIKNKNIYYRDFKLFNIGFDSDLNFIVLDYDNITLVKRNDPNFINCLNIYNIPNSSKEIIDKKNYSINVCNGTFLPLISKSDYVTDFIDFKFEKYYCIALADIMLNMYAIKNEAYLTLSTEIPLQSKVYDSVKSSILNNFAEINEPMEIVGGDNNSKQHIQDVYLNDFKEKYNKLTFNFEKYECDIRNLYYEYNFYDDLLQFIKTTITNMVNPDSHKIMTEQQILDFFIGITSFYRN